MKQGVYLEIHTSIKSGSAIECTVKEVDPALFGIVSVNNFTVVPPVDHVEIRARADGGTVINVEKIQTFDAAEGYGVMELAVPEATYSYIIEYRYTKGGSTTNWETIPSDGVSGYYEESSYDGNGNITGTPSKKTYVASSTTGFIELVRSPTSYTDTIASLITGDKYGYDSFFLDNGAAEVKFTAGTDDFVQRCKGVAGGGAMTLDHIIGLSNDDAVEGNSFTFIFDVGINPGAFSLTFNSGYVSSGTPGTVIRTFTADQFSYPGGTEKSVTVKCTYNGSAWESYMVEDAASENILFEYEDLTSPLSFTTIESTVSTLNSTKSSNKLKVTFSCHITHANTGGGTSVGTTFNIKNDGGIEKTVSQTIENDGAAHIISIMAVVNYTAGDDITVTAITSTSNVDIVEGTTVIEATNATN